MYYKMVMSAIFYTAHNGAHAPEAKELKKFDTL